jgi:hypothetical protein
MTNSQASPSMECKACVHICARSRQGKFTVHVKTIAKRLGRGLKAIWEWCKQHRHEAVNEQQKTLNAKLGGHCAKPLFMLRCDRNPVMLTWFDAARMGRDGN